MGVYSLCTFLCPVGFTTDVTAPEKASRTRTLACQLNGEWDAQAPQCHGKRFPVPFVFEAGVHNPERGTAMRSSHGVFTDQFIFRTVLKQSLDIFLIPQTSQQNLQT